MRRPPTIKDVVDASRPTFPRKNVGEILQAMRGENSSPIAFTEDAPPVVGEVVPAGYVIVRTDGRDLLQTGGVPITFNGKRVLTDGRDLYVEAA